jgi:hypothetical protein
MSSGNACCYSLQNLFSSRLLSKSIKEYTVLYFCPLFCMDVTCSLTLTEELKLRYTTNLLMDYIHKQVSLVHHVPSSESFQAYKLRVFENSVLRRIFIPKRHEVTEGWRKLYNKDLCDLYSSPSIIRIANSRRMTWAKNVARIRRRGTCVRHWWEFPWLFSPQGNYINWATATGRRILMPTFADRGMSRGQRGGTPTAVNLVFSFF